jgi:hypothetical protein
LSVIFLADTKKILNLVFILKRKEEAKQIISSWCPFTAGRWDISAIELGMAWASYLVFFKITG